MPFTLTRASWRLDLAPRVVGVMSAWAIGVVAVAAVQARSGFSGSPLCLFRRVTGVPCATCGGTRAVLAALRGHVFDAFLLNPLVFVGLIAGASWLVTRVGFGRRVELRMTPVRWIALGALFVLNWAWVVARDVARDA